MLVAAPACATSQPAVPGVSALLLPQGCFLMIMQVCGAGGRQGEARTPPREPCLSGERHGCQTCAVSPPCIAEGACYVWGGQSSAHTVYPQEASPAGIRPSTF